MSSNFFRSEFFLAAIFFRGEFFAGTQKWWSPPQNTTFHLTTPYDDNCNIMHKGNYATATQAPPLDKLLVVVNIAPLALICGLWGGIYIILHTITLLFYSYIYKLVKKICKIGAKL